MKSRENKSFPKLILDNVSQSTETVTQGVTQSVAHYARKRSDSSHQKPKHCAGPYLMRRGRVFYFRKRLPRALSNLQSNSFLCLSLRTDLPLDAVKRAARLLTVCERMEKEIVDALNSQDLSPADTKALLTEALRAELARILAEQSSMGSLTDEDADKRIEELEAENNRLRRAARRENWMEVQELLEKASSMIGLTLPGPLSPDLGRQVTTLKRRINDIESDVTEGDDIRTACRPLLNDHDIKDFDKFVQEPILLSQAWAQTRKNYPNPSMQGNINALEKLTLEFFGDIPVTAITKDRQKAFFAWEARLPRSQGRAHGKNRFNKDGQTILKATEISTADAHDLMVTEEIRERSDISVAEKRAILADKLVPRRTMTTIRRDRDGLNRLFKSVRELGVNPPEALSYKEVEKHVKDQAPDDELYVRVTKPKIRMPWTEERLARFLTSPIYTGCLSEHRRWKRGSLIIRDATYWVPLIVLTIGSRIEEILLMKRSDIRYRNSHYCFAIGTGPEQPGKTEDSKRVIPVPQLLLDLGFVEWFHALSDDHGILLFPEAARRTTSGDVTSAFGKHLRRILDHLGLGDFDEDFYAMRKTLSSMLNSAHVSDGQRQAIAGHRHGTILNIHYTAHHTKDLKDAVDKADFKLEISRRRQYGFPVIKSCNLASAAVLTVDVTLGDNGEAATVSVYDNEASEPVFNFVRSNNTTIQELRSVACKLREILSQRPLALPKNSLKRAAFEHLQALA